MPRAVSEEAWFAVRVKQEELLGLDKRVDYEREGSVQGNARVRDEPLNQALRASGHRGKEGLARSPGAQSRGCRNMAFGKDR